MDGQHLAGEVADILGVSRPAATKNIDKLVRSGLIVRRRSQGDRRATLLTISPKGRRLVQRCEGLKRNRMSALLEGFTPTEIDRLTGLLDRLSVALLRKDRPTAGPCLRCGAYLESGCPVGSMQGGCPYREVRGDSPAGDLPGGIA
jgi:DNA-binding MarR family transcriptional regulator